MRGKRLIEGTAKRFIFSCGLPEDDFVFDRLSTPEKVASKVVGSIGRAAFNLCRRPVVGNGREAFVLGHSDKDIVYKVFWGANDLAEEKDRLIRDYEILRSCLGGIALSTDTDIRRFGGRNWVVQTQPWIHGLVDFRNTADYDNSGVRNDFIKILDARDTILDKHGLLIDLARSGNLGIADGRPYLVDVSLALPPNNAGDTALHQRAEDMMLQVIGSKLKAA